MSALLRRWGRKRCTTEFEAVVGRHIEQLYHLAYRFAGSAAAAEDLLQDVLVKSFAQWDSIRHYERLEVWLARVLYNEYIDSWRRARLQPQFWSALTEGDLERFEAFPDPRRSANPPRMVSDQQLAVRLTEGLRRLSPRLRAVLLLHDVEEYTLQECAEIFCEPVGTCKSRVFRARSKLREFLGHDLRYWIDEDSPSDRG